MFCRHSAAASHVAASSAANAHVRCPCGKLLSVSNTPATRKRTGWTPCLSLLPCDLSNHTHQRMCHSPNEGQKDWLDEELEAEEHAEAAAAEGRDVSDPEESDGSEQSFFEDFRTAVDMGAAL